MYQTLLTFKLKKGVAIDIDHRVTKQQYTPYSLSMGLRVVERPVVWHEQNIINLTSIWKDHELEFYYWYASVLTIVRTEPDKI